MGKPELAAARSLDAVLAGKVMGWRREGDLWIDSLTGRPRPTWSPSTDLSDAWVVVSYLQARYDFALDTRDPSRRGRWVATVVPKGDVGVTAVRVLEETAALAVSRAIAQVVVGTLNVDEEPRTL